MQVAAATGQKLDVLGIGNAIVDVLSHSDDGLLTELGLEKGAMTLVDEERSEFLYRRMGPGREVSGGSCANTIAAIASMGGSGAYIGRVRDDALGRIFAHDIRAAGVRFDAAPQPDGPATARCLIFVTDDAQRTTDLSQRASISAREVDEDLSPASPYFEGYSKTSRQPRPPARRLPTSATPPATSWR